MPFAPLARCEGAGGTSFLPPFPGRPGLSQSCSQWRFSDPCAATVLSRNEEEVACRPRKLKPLFCTFDSPAAAVNNLGAKSFTGYSPRRTLRVGDGGGSGIAGAATGISWSSRRRLSRAVS